MALTKISGNVVQPSNFSLSGVVTATSFTGDLTGNVSSSGANTLGSLTVTNDATVGGALTVTGDLTVNGTTTTIDTAVTAVDSLAIDGSVGIGTDNPRSKLDINGTDSELRFYRDAGDRFGGLRYTGSKFTLKLPASDHFVIDDATGNEKLRVTSSGNVGIGTDNPGAKLEVHSDSIPRINSIFQGSKHFGMSVGGSGGGFVVTDGHYMTINHQPYSDRGTDNNLTERLRVTSGGNVGIGTDNPSAKLHLSNNGSTQMMISNMSSGMSDGDTIGVLDFTAGPNHTTNARIAGLVEGTDELGGDLVFETRADGGSLLEKLRITSGGQVNIGNSFTQTTWLTHIEGAYNKAGLRVVSGAPGYSDPFVVATSTGGERFRITGDGNIGINTNDPTSKITINVDSNNQTMASYDGINISNSDTTVNNGSAVIFGFGPSSPNSFSRIGVQNKDRGSGTESQDLFFGTISNGSYAERLRIGTNGRLCLHNVTDGANSSYGKFEIQHVGANGIDPNTSYLSFHRTANTAFQMGIVDNKFVLGVTGGAARDDVQTPHVVFDPTGTDTILGLGTTIPNGKGLDITHSRTNSYSQTTDQRNLAHLILRNGSDAPDRFTSLSMVSGGGTQAEGSINLVQNGNYRGHFAFKLRHSGGSTDWMERFRIGTDGELIQYSYGSYIRHYTTTTNDSLYRTTVAVEMSGNVAYELRFTGAGNGVVWIKAMGSHWTSSYGLVRESYCFMDAYASLSEANQYSLTSSTQGSWSFSRPASGQTGYQSHLIINKSAGTYGGGMVGIIILESDRPFSLYSIT